MDIDLKHHSRYITDGRDQAPARAMYKAIGFTDADLAKPLIAVANTWIETMPCNFHLRRLSAKVKEGIRAAGGTPMEFNTIAISDGETMGTEGMKASLVSREVIADSIELVCRGQLFDAAVCVVGCDKTIPAAAMALARMNLPGLVLYGGTIAAGKYKGKDVTIQDVFEAVGANAAGKMSDADLLELENVACPGAGACGGQYTANTMSTVMELIGLSPMGFNGIPAMDPRKDEVAFRCGEVVMNLLKQGIRPSDILTHAAFENAIAGVATTGGSTNAVLHLLAISREMGLPLDIDDFQRVSERTPLLADLKPAGKFVAADVDAAGGIQLIAKRLLDGKHVDGATMTVTGKTFAEEANNAKETAGQTVIAPLSKPLKTTGGLVILKGNLAPGGGVVKMSGHERQSQTGPARVFDSEEAAMKAVTSKQIKAGDVVVIRYEGPKGGPGMREMLSVTAAIVGEGLGESGSADNRRPLQRSNPRPDGRPRSSRSRAGRPNRRHPRRRQDHHRHQDAQTRAGNFRRRNRKAHGGMESSRATLQNRRLRKVRRAGKVGIRGRNHNARSSQSLQSLNTRAQMHAVILSEAKDLMLQRTGFSRRSR